MTQWEIHGKSFTNCNCAYGCPCQFNALPTYGNCEAIEALDIAEGSYGETKLDGLRVCATMWWPGPIHEGGGKAFLVVDESANEDQRNALLAICTGQDTDPGATIWNVFAATLSELFDPVFLPIEIDIDVEARTAQVRAEDVINSNGSPILNPITGDEHRAQIHLPNGFEYDIAEMGSGSSISNGPFQLKMEDTYGQFNEIHIGSHGVIRH